MAEHISPQDGAEEHDNMETTDEQDTAEEAGADRAPDATKGYKNMDPAFLLLMQDITKCFRQQLLAALPGPKATIILTDNSTALRGARDERCCSVCSPDVLQPLGPAIAPDRLPGLGQLRGDRRSPELEARMRAAILQCRKDIWREQREVGSTLCGGRSTILPRISWRRSSASVFEWRQVLHSVISTLIWYTRFRRRSGKTVSGQPWSTVSVDGRSIRKRRESVWKRRQRQRNSNARSSLQPTRMLFRCRIG